MPDASAPSTVDFPLADGRRSSSATSMALVRAAAARVDPALAQRVDGERDWRHAYPTYLKDLLVASLADADAAVAVARAGLDELRARMVLAGPDGDRPLVDAVAADRGEQAPAHVREVLVRGSGERERELTVPLHGERLRGDALHRQLDDWLARGIVEPSHAEAVRAVMAHPDWLELDDLEPALLGAGAEMAPLQALLRWGATVRAVDVPSPAVWTRLCQLADASAGALVVPVPAAAATDVDPATVAGLDLLADPRAVRDWLERAERRLVLGNYLYADAAAFLRLSAAADAVSTAVVAARPGTVLAALATPTDVFAVPADAVATARERYAERGWRGLAQAPVRAATGDRLFRPNYRTTVAGPGGEELGIADSLVVQQGPSYALAKTVQRWQAVAAAADGTRVSANVAPPTRTRSVLRNRVLAAAYAGAGRFGVEVFAPSTSSTLMAALLVHDLRAPAPVLSHPHELWMRGANPGGLWRVAYEPRSVLGLAVLLGLLPRR